MPVADPRPGVWRRPRNVARLAATLHFYAALGLGWGHAMLFFTPDSLATELSDSGITGWTIGTGIGGVLAIVGYALKLARSRRRQLRGLSIEMVGILALAGGPLQYLLIQGGLIADGKFEDRYALAWFAYAMLAAILIRVASVLPDFVTEATGKGVTG